MTPASILPAALVAFALCCGACASNGDSPPEGGAASEDLAPVADRGPGDAAPDGADAHAAEGGVDASALRPEQFVGSWRFVEMLCEASEPITFVDYSYTLQLETTRGTAVDATASCALTTRDFALVKAGLGYELDYDSAAQLSCSPSPCELTIVTKVGSQTSGETYTCPDDFPIESPTELIIAVEGDTLTTGFYDLPCRSSYQRIER